MARKFKGISADVLNTTHPICNNIKSVDEAESVFNGISYGKGAAFLKQVNKVLGQEDLKKALHVYFKKYQWKNTELKDFVEVLEDVYNQKKTKNMGKQFNFRNWCD
jgi:aminopeptidase N